MLLSQIKKLKFILQWENFGDNFFSLYNSSVYSITFIFPIRFIYISGKKKKNANGNIE